MTTPEDTREVLYLEEDKPIRGQNYVCMSFISPEDILANKEVFFVHKFIDSLSKDLTMLLTNLQAKYPDDKQIFEAIRENQAHFFEHDQLQEQFRFFKQNSNSDLEREFHAQNEFRTSIRGFKVRGTFDTYQEAELRAKALKRAGDKFDIYVANVGCWCPWSPTPGDIPNQEYGNAQLNELMKKYHDNMEQRESIHDERIQKALSSSKKKPDIEAEDPWIQRKRAEMETKTVIQDEVMKLELESIPDATPKITE